MNKIISLLTIFFVLSSIYFLPSLTAITLGEIKSDKQQTETPKKNEQPDNVKKNPDKVPGKKEESKEKKEELKDKKDEINPRLVCLLSAIVPGGGHFYLNNDAKGVGFCLAAGAGYTASGYFLLKTMLADVGSVSFKNYLLITGFIFCMSVVIHFIGIIEAYSDADEVNREKLFGNSDNNPYITEFLSK